MFTPKKFIFSGFTLAEVLITLTIIGVIAAITIPNLMQKYEKQQTVTKLKKAYNNINRMAKNIQQNSGCDDLECVNFYSLVNSTSVANTGDLQKKFVELAGVKDAKVFVEQPWIYSKTLYCANTGCESIADIRNYFITQDGLLYSVVALQSNTMLRISVATKQYVKGKTSYIKGKDLFYFVISNNYNVSPAGVYGNTAVTSETENWEINNGCAPNSSSAYFLSCAARIIRNGWEIDYY